MSFRTLTEIKNAFKESHNSLFFVQPLKIRCFMNLHCIFPNWVKNTNYSLHKICENTGFHWPLFSRIRTKSTSLSLYRRIRVSENPHSRIFYVVTETHNLILKVSSLKNTFISFFSISKNLQEYQNPKVIFCKDLSLLQEPNLP